MKVEIDVDFVKLTQYFTVSVKPNDYQEMVSSLEFKVLKVRGHKKEIYAMGKLLQIHIIKKYSNTSTPTSFKTYVLLCTETQLSPKMSVN